MANSLLNVMIEQLHILSDRQIEDTQALMLELAPNIHVSAEMLKNAVGSDNTHFFALMEDDGRIVGCASLCVFNSPTGRKASVEDVVVLSSCRGLGYGRKLMEHIIDYAKKELVPIDLHLTSNPARVSANALYKAVGFERRETNVYQLRLLVKG